MSKPERRIRDRILDWAADAARHPAAQSAVVALGILELVHPGLGVTAGSAGAGLTSALGARMDRQAKETLEAVRSRIDHLEKQGKLDDAQLKHETDTASTFVKAFLAAAQDDAEKVELYADLLAGLVSVDRPDQALDSAVLLSCLSRLDPSTVALARHMSDQYDRDTWAVASGVERPEWGPDTDYHLQHLQAEGLISPIFERTGDFGSNPSTAVFRYHLTPTLHRLIGTLEAGRGSAPPE